MTKSNFLEVKGFEDFRKLANDQSLSIYEKIGFPDVFRKSKESLIFQDICGKLPHILSEEKVILDIGPGCAEIPMMLINECKKNRHHLLLADSEEMLRFLPNHSGISKFPGFFPLTATEIAKSVGAVDAILCYSVFHYIYVDIDYFLFIDACINLLKDGGQMLLGDIPNLDKRNRFFASKNGIAFHQAYMSTAGMPKPLINSPELNAIDEKVLDSIVKYVRIRGCDAYIVPQPEFLPMANRRDDLIIRKP